MALREDTYRHKGLRDAMCRALRNKGIADESVLKAINTVPRHWFVDLALDNLAYEDMALPIENDQTLSQPSTVAAQSQLLEVRSGMKVLEIGTGSGYQSAVLCEMGVRLYTIERQRALYLRSKKLLSDMRYTAKCFLGDGYAGLAEMELRTPAQIQAAPDEKNKGIFDRVLVTCGAPYIPEALMGQLKAGGIMVIPVAEVRDDEHSLEMLRVVKRGDDREQWEITRHGGYDFVPMLGGKQD